jgi:hypothetical protein
VLIAKPEKPLDADNPTIKALAESARQLGVSTSRGGKRSITISLSYSAELLYDPQVTSNLWLPEQNTALELIAQSPTRVKMLEGLSHKQLNIVTKDFLRAAALDLDPELHKT